jgi:hypothetical protein
LIFFSISKLNWTILTCHLLINIIIQFFSSSLIIHNISKNPFIKKILSLYKFPLLVIIIILILIKMKNFFLNTYLVLFQLIIVLIIAIIISMISFSFIQWKNSYFSLFKTSYPNLFMILFHFVFLYIFRILNYYLILLKIHFNLEQ